MTPTGAKMFRAAALVFKNGDLVVRDGAVVQDRWGRALAVAPTPDRAIVRRLDDYLQRALRASLD